MPSPAKPPLAKLPPLLICTPFGLGMRDQAWFEHRLELISAITAPSLLAQSEHRFQWAVFVDAGIPPTVRKALEDVLDPFEGHAYVHTAARYNAEGMRALATERTAVEGRIFTARLDDDDAWQTETVAIVRRRAADWLSNPGEASGFAMTFEHGYEWMMYDMYEHNGSVDGGDDLFHEGAVRRFDFPFLSMSVFVLADADSPVCALSRPHPRMGRFAARHGLAVNVISSEEPMWLYCRHKQAQSGYRKSRSEDLEIGVDELSDRFGIDRGSVESYIAGADEHGHALVKDVKRVRGRLKWRLGQVNREIDSSAAASDLDRLRKLHDLQSELIAEVTRCSDCVVGTNDADPGNDSRIAALLRRRV